MSSEYKQIKQYKKKEDEYQKPKEEEYQEPEEGEYQDPKGEYQEQEQEQEEEQEDSNVKYIEPEQKKYSESEPEQEDKKSFTSKIFGDIAQKFKKKREITGYDYIKHSQTANKCANQTLFISTTELSKLKSDIQMFVKQQSQPFIIQLENIIKNLKKYQNLNFDKYIDIEINKLINKNNDLKTIQKKVFSLSHSVKVIFIRDGINMSGIISSIEFKKIPEFIITLIDTGETLQIPSNLLCVDNKDIDFDYPEKYNIGQIGGNMKTKIGGSNSGIIRSKNDNLSDTSNTSIVDKTAEVKTTTGSVSSNVNYCE